MNARKAPYHHGDLRASLVEAAAGCVETDGAAKLSLRKIAAQLGVSHNAPYMHFASKDALLDAVIAHGFAELRAGIAAAGGREALGKADWKGRVRQGLRAYVDFARARPGLYALMHVPKGRPEAGREPPESGTGAQGTGPKDTGAPGTDTLKGLAATLRAGQQLGEVRDGDAGEMALWVWATLHGLASLTSADRLAFEGRSPEAVTDTVLDHLIAALAGPGSAAPRAAG